MVTALSPVSPDRRSRREIFKLFLSEKQDPAPFYAALALRTLDDFAFPLRGASVVDLGCGHGHYTRALRQKGATVLPIDLDATALRSDGESYGAVAADACRLPVPTSSSDGVFCSNLLEHAPDTSGVFAEIGRILRPGGWAWVSWTNWFSPWGGHEITPFQYLGPRWGLRAHRRLRGEPSKNVPGEGLFPVHVGTTLSLLRDHRELRLIDAFPRYYPSQRWVVRVPVLREVMTWNCVLLLERQPC